MRYLRKETAFMLENKIIIPDCINRFSNFDKEEAQTFCVMAKNGSFTITIWTACVLNPTSIFAGATDAILVPGENNVLAIPQNVLSKSGMLEASIVTLYLVDANTIEVFPSGKGNENDGCFEQSTQNKQGRRNTQCGQSINDMRGESENQTTAYPKLSGDFFVVENKHEILKVRLSEIYYFEKIKGTHNTCVVHRGGIFTFKSNIRNVLSKLDDSRFVLCHKAFIVNTANIKRIEKMQSVYMLHFEDKHRCPCSLFYRKAVMMNWNHMNN